MLGKSDVFRRRLLRWYELNRRDLPWRVPLDAPKNHRVDPYYVLVSEAMLQQTQVATVIDYFRRFIRRMPTISDLASADEQQVLRLWQGLGYYSRARNLQATARIICSELGGQIPCSPEELMKLPGIGRYTAGAIASLAFEKRAAILDGNVARVLCRIDAVAEDPRDPATRDQLWERSASLLPRRSVRDFNSSLMELGAMICTPRQPRCATCPVKVHCAAFAAGLQEQIPRKTSAKPRPVERRIVLCIQSGGRWLIEQRPASGRWAGMWQFVTLPTDACNPTAEALGQSLGLRIGDLAELAKLRHDLTHRRYEFAAFTCRLIGPLHPGERFRLISPEQFDDYPLPRPHLKLASMLAESGLPCPS